MTKFRLCILLLLAATACAQKPCAYTFQIEHLTIDSHPITIERYTPTATGPHPILLMIHGSAGIFTLHNNQQPHPSNFGEDEFAKHCYTVILPHYFERTGLATDRSITDESRLRQLFPAFQAELTSVLTLAYGQPETNGQPIFLYGESYGGFLAIALATQLPQIQSVSVYGAGLPQPLQPTRTTLPSLLIQHGDQDSIVPPSNATDLQHLWQRSYSPVQVILYPGEGHYFSDQTRQKLLTNTLAWFAAHKESK